MSWLHYYGDEHQRWHMPKLLTLTICFAIVFAVVAWVYDLGVKQGQIGALKTAYEVCRKVAPCE